MRVLIVDDDPDFVLLLQRALELRGHSVQSVSSAFGLVNRAAGSAGGARPDIIVLDCGLPGLSGPSALELLGRDRRTADLPVVLCSAVVDGAIGLSHKRALFVQKDGRFKRLVEQVEQHASSWAPAVVRR